jgi:hypothetical protein
MATDREYRIRIQTVGDASGAQQVAGALDKTTGATQAATQATEKHGAGLHALNKIFHVLNEVVPGLGVLMQAAFSPVGAAISIAVMAMRAFQEHTRRVNEELKKMEEEAAKPLTKRLEAMREGTVALSAAQAELGERLAHTGHSERGVREEIEKTLEAQKRQIELARQVADANKENELAGLEAIHAAGLLSDERYFAAKLEADEKYRKKKRELDEAEEMRGILAQRRALEVAEMNQPALTATAEEATGKREKALEDLGSLDKAGAAERKKSTAEALKKWEDAHRDEYWGGLINAFEGAGVKGDGRPATDTLISPANRLAQVAAGTLGSTESDINKKFSEWQKLKADAVGTEAEWKAFPKEEAKRKVAADAATAAAERAQKKALENQDLIEYHRTLPEKTAAFKERAGANAEDDLAFNDVARQKMKASPGGAAVAGGAEALQRLMNGEKWDLTKEGDAGEVNNFRSLARLLKSMPSRERNQPEPNDRTGLNFSRQEARVFQDSARDVALQTGQRLDSTSQQANAELVQLLSGLHGLQSETLRTIASHVNNTQLLTQDLAAIRKKVDDQARAAARSTNTLPGN